MFSLKHEFANEWYRFLHPADTADKQTLQLDLTQERFPFQFRGRTIEISEVELFLKFRDIVDPNTYTLDQNHTPLGDYTTGGIPASLALCITPAPRLPNTEVAGTLSSLFLGLPHASFAFSNAVLTRLPGEDFWLLEAQNVGNPLMMATSAISPPKLRNIVKTNGKSVHHLNPEVIEDIIIVCHIV